MFALSVYPKAIRALELNGIDGCQDLLKMVALHALKCEYIKLKASRQNGRKKHRAPALRTFLTFDCHC